MYVTRSCEKMYMFGYPSGNQTRIFTEKCFGENAWGKFGKIFREKMLLENAWGKIEENPSAKMLGAKSKEYSGKNATNTRETMPGDKRQKSTGKNGENAPVMKNRKSVVKPADNVW